METKHTPGPWEVFSNSFIEAGVRAANNPYGTDFEFRIAEVSGDWRDEPKGGAAAANARLIAAAPELLEALTAMVDAHDRWLGSDRPDAKEAMKRARAAIAKAEGRS